MDKTQKGFSAVEGLLLLVIVGLIGFVGWFVWNSNSQTNKSLDDADKVNQSAVPKLDLIKSFNECKKAGGRIQESYPEVCTLGSKNFTNSNQERFLVIKEWGVKLKLDINSKDAYYSFPLFDKPQTQYLDLNSQDLNQLKTYNGKTCKDEYIAIMGRYKKNDPALTTNEAPEAAIGDRKSLGDYVYTFSTHKQYASPCLFDMSDNSGRLYPLVGNTKVYDKKVAAYTKMYETMTAQ